MDFRGFQAGFGEEGSKGLEKALKMLGIKDWDTKTINELEPGKYKIKGD